MFTLDFLQDSMGFCCILGRQYCIAGMSEGMTQGKIDLRNESGRPMKVKVVGEVSEK